MPVRKTIWLGQPVPFEMCLNALGLQVQTDKENPHE